MKKTYTKPEINFDSFGITTTFASTCSFHPEYADDHSCGYNMHRRVIFVSENSGCKYVSADGAYGICYYVPTGDSNVFIS